MKILAGKPDSKDVDKEEKKEKQSEFDQHLNQLNQISNNNQINNKINRNRRSSEWSSIDLSRSSSSSLPDLASFEPNKRPSISASSASSAVIFDKNDILVVTTVSDADIEALKADRLFNKYVWYCLMFLFTLGFLGSVFCALGFAYVKYYQDYIKEVAAGVTSGGGGDYINHGDLGPHSSHPVT